MPTPTPLLIFLSTVIAIVVLTGGLGVLLGLTFLWLDRQLHPVAEPAAARTVKPATVTHRIAGPGAAVFALVVLLTGVLVGRYVQLTPIEAANRAPLVDTLFSTMLGIGGAIFLLVEGILVFSAWRFRRRKGEVGDGIPIHGSNRLEVAWTIIPTLIVLWIGAYSYQILAQITTMPGEVMTVNVISRQFQWEFHYPEADITSNDLHVPVGQAVRLNITSEDVLHSFWVPAFRIKQDAIPNRETEAYFTASTPGTYRVVCAELCGAGHGRMGLTSQAVVQNQSEFDAWVAEQQIAAGQPADPVTLFARYGCDACHALAAAAAVGQVGPGLDRIGTEAATRVPGLSAEEYIRQSILEPNAFVAPQCPAGPCVAGVMPQDLATRIPAAHLDALVSFLLEQR